MDSKPIDRNGPSTRKVRSLSRFVFNDVNDVKMLYLIVICFFMVFFVGEVCTESSTFKEAESGRGENVLFKHSAQMAIFYARYWELRSDCVNFDSLQ